MNSKQLQYFLITVQKGSIAAAARELDIAQPAISQQLANLEREMGAPLFARSFKGVALTTAGEVFANHARRLVEDINTAKADLQRLVENQAGTVRVGMLPSIGNVLSMPLIAEVNQWHPKLKLEISTGPSYSVRGWLETRQIDIAITYEQDIVMGSMKCEPLIEEYMHLVVGANDHSEIYQALKHRECIEFWELSQFELLSPTNKEALGMLIEKYEKSTGVALRHNKAYSGQLMTGLRQVMQGEGLMILPSSAIFHLEESGLVNAIKIVAPEMKRHVLIATNNSDSLSDATIRMKRIIRKVTAQEQALDHWRGEMTEGAAATAPLMTPAQEGRMISR
ncbi:LysR family transcriptional regulator [Alteromonas pelagimontana]|uniref:LysR family transcriptional regulator n=1 Tax=Alteromonas pelagimontana TaxID=1858656 RepID=A0A6M4MEX1_9ALTE|nr:LysR family transcriptional regulator [Alteromonas pelagimontana]QJR81639.1 LysR family transcriptional regulator [Alteromonas pelagimontana]